MPVPNDILVIGGGPAGSVTATLLSQEGLRVRLVEAKKFPRYHIGESLTPATRRVLQLVGIADALDAGGFQVKRGGAFRWGEDSWTIDWGGLFGDQVRAWQVDRAEFDQMLLDNASAKGVQVQQGVAAKSVSFDTDGRPVAVTCAGGNDPSFDITGFDTLIDASGRAGLLSAQHLRNRRPHQFFRNVAIWGYWTGARLLPDSPEGAVNVISSPKGWWWVIPLHSGRTSVGLVTHKDTFAADRRAHTSLDTLYRALVAECDTVAGLLADAACQGPAQVETDYSYVADQFSGSGYMLVGDAACFLDPLLSTGVHLALYGGMVAAAALASAHRGEVTEPEGRWFFETAYRRAYTRALALVSSMYERYRGKDDFFWTADRLAHPGTATGSRQGPASFGEIIAGLTDWRESTDATTRVVTAQLEAEARRVHQDAPASAGTRPDLTALHTDPSSDEAIMGLRVVTEPHLGLQHVPTP